MFVTEQNYYKKNLQNINETKKFLKEISKNYDYIIMDISNSYEKEHFIKNANEIIVLVEGNLLGLKETKEILEEVVNKQKNQKDNIKIIYNKQTNTSINKQILNKIFSDFEIIGDIQYDKYYNIFINTNAKYITKKIKKEYLKITKKI